MRYQIYTYLLLFTGAAVISCSSSTNSGGSTPNPSINSIQPTSGPPGTMVTISGQGFRPDAASFEVRFSGETAAIEDAGKTEFKAEVPDEAETGAVQVSVGEKTINGPTFTVEAEAPGITSVQPDSGVVGTKVTITGMNFSSIASENTIKFGGLEAPVQSASESKLETEVPQNATDGPITVTVKSKSTTGPEFDMLEPRITTVIPDTAVVGAKVLVAGEYFSDEASENNVSIGGVEAQVDSVFGDTLATTVPEGATDGPLQVIVGELASGEADFEIITTITACYGNDVGVDASLEWVSQGITTSDKDDKSQDMAIDADGNLYVVLRDRGTVGKFDPQGDKVWEANFDSKLKSTTWRGIDYHNGNLYIVGERSVSQSNLGDAKLDYHFTKLKNDNPSPGIADPVLARLDASSGSLAWAQQFGSPDLDEVNHETVTVLPSGQILVAAKMSGPFTPSNQHPNSGTHDVGIAKFDENGNLVTVKQISAYTAPYSITTDDQRRVYLGARTDDGNTVFSRLNSDLKQQVASEQVTNQIKPPIPMPDGGAVVYGNTGTSVESGVNVYIKDAYVQRLDASGQQQWVHQQKFDDSGSTKFVGGVRLPGGGIVLAAQNASEIGGLPYLAVYADDGLPLFIDGSAKSTFFEFEDDKKGRGYPSAIESYRNAEGDIKVFTMGVTTSSWPYRNDDDEDDPHGGKDMWMTGMSLQCSQQNQ